MSNVTFEIAMTITDHAIKVLRAKQDVDAAIIHLAAAQAHLEHVERALRCATDTEIKRRQDHS